jgi:hypothetical protein
VDQAAEAVTAANPVKHEDLASAVLLDWRRQGERPSLLEFAVRSVLVVMQHVGREGVLEVTEVATTNGTATVDPASVCPRLARPQLRASTRSGSSSSRRRLARTRTSATISCKHCGRAGRYEITVPDTKVSWMRSRRSRTSRSVDLVRLRLSPSRRVRRRRSRCARCPGTRLAVNSGGRYPSDDITQIDARFPKSSVLKAISFSTGALALRSSLRPGRRPHHACPSGNGPGEADAPRAVSLIPSPCGGLRRWSRRVCRYKRPTEQKVVTSAATPRPEADAQRSANAPTSAGREAGARSRRIVVGVIASILRTPGPVGTAIAVAPGEAAVGHAPEPDDVVVFALDGGAPRVAYERTNYPTAKGTRS